MPIEHVKGFAIDTRFVTWRATENRGRCNYAAVEEAESQLFGRSSLFRREPRETIYWHNRDCWATTRLRAPIVASSTPLLCWHPRLPPSLHSSFETHRHRTIVKSLNIANDSGTREHRRSDAAIAAAAAATGFRKPSSVTFDLFRRPSATTDSLTRPAAIWIQHCAAYGLRIFARHATEVWSLTSSVACQALYQWANSRVQK